MHLVADVRHWPASQELMFYRDNMPLRVCSFVILLSVEAHKVKLGPATTTIPCDHGKLIQQTHQIMAVSFSHVEKSKPNMTDGQAMRIARA